jgi:maltose O-acetyltransferase
MKVRHPEVWWRSRGLRPIADRFKAELPMLPRNTLINGVAGAHWMPALVRTTIYRLGGLNVSWRASVAPCVIIRGKQLTLGCDSTVNYRCIIDAGAPVRIGSNCGIAMGVQLITSSHERSDPSVRAGKGKLAPITIGDGVWIGSNAVVLGGVRIGDGCVIAAGAVVSRDCEEHGLYSGVPARRTQDLSG